MATISAWAKNVIRFAYDNNKDYQRQLHGLRVHETRAISASLAVQSTFSMTSILENCTWKDHSTFTDYYLRDMTNVRNGLRTLGPIVAAGTIV